MKVIRWILLALALSMLCVEVEAGQKLTIATEGAYPPFNYVDDGGHLAGFDVEIARALCEAMDADCAIIAIKWDDILNGLEIGHYDAIVASMAKTPGRAQVADFTDYYYRSRSTFAGNPNIPFKQTREGVKGLVLAAQRDTVQAQYLTTNFNDAATIKLTKNTNEAFSLLAAGTVDAVLSDSLTIYDFLQTEAGKPFDFVGNPLPAKDPSSEASIAVSKGTGLVDEFNKALKTIRLNGVYNKINHRYFPFSIY